MSAPLLAIAIDAIVKPSIVLLLTLGLAAVFRRQSATLRHLIWAVGLVSALLVPLLGRTLPEWQPKVAGTVIGSIARIQQTEAPAAQLSTPSALQEPASPVVVPSRPPAAQPARAISLVRVAFAIWVSGLLVSVARLLAEFIKLGRVSLHSSPVREHVWLGLSREVADALQLKRTVRLMRSSSGSVLGAWGAIRPRVILPRESEDWPEERMRAVLGHEFAHVKRNDWLAQMIAEVAKGIFWFNPLFWIACSRLRRESEHACDDAVLRLGIDGPSYATHMLDLVRMLKSSRQPGTVMVMAGASNLEIRLAAVLNPSLNRSVVANGAIVVVSLLALGLTLPLAAMHSPAAPESIQAAAQKDPAEAAKGSEMSSAPITPGHADRSARFASRSEAAQAGCRFAHVKGPAVDACVLALFGDRQVDLAIYEKSKDGSYATSRVLAFTSWYEDATLSIINGTGDGTDWMVIATEGMHGAGIRQRILLVTAWDGKHFRTVASETLDYGCFRPTSRADYVLRVRHAFEPLSGKPGIRLDYELTQDERRIGAWSDQLRWNPSRFAFAPFRTSVDLPSPLVDRIRELIERTRVYATAEQLNPENDVARQRAWAGNSGLWEVMNPACLTASLATGTREFVGKWTLDEDRTSKSNSSQARPSAPLALVVGWDKTALRMWEGGGEGNGKPYDYSLVDRETSVPVGSSAGRAKAEWVGDQLVVTITIAGRPGPVVRRYYREGYDLVVESTDGDGRPIRAFYQKS